MHAVSTTVRVSDDTHARLTALAAATGRRMQTIVEDAVAAHEAHEFWATFAAGYDGLADDPAAWLQVQVQSERAGEETALNRQCRAELKPVARRGEVWLVDFGTPVGHEQGFQRPAVVVSDDRLNGSRAELVIVIPTITTRRGCRPTSRSRPVTVGWPRPATPRLKTSSRCPRIGTSADSVRFRPTDSTTPSRCSGRFSVCDAGRSRQRGCPAPRA